MIKSTSETLFRLSNLDKEQQRISYQTSSTEILQYGSDDANLYTRKIYLDDKMKVYEGIEEQINKTTAQNLASDSTMKEIKELLEYVMQEVQKGITATTDQDAREAIATNLKGVKENLYMLSNEQMEGEYLYAGSDSMKQPFVKDDSGKVTYQGDSFLRKVVVEDGSYRERGITGFENFMYTVEAALKGETLEFSAEERILDESSYEWKLEASTPVTTAPATINFQANDVLIDENGTSWKVNDTIPSLENSNGDSIAITGTGPYSLDMSSIAITPATATVPTELSTAQLVKYDEEGLPTADTLSVKASSTLGKDYEVVLPNVDGTKFEAKGNTFDIMDKIINALEQKDADGNDIPNALATEELTESLKLIQTANDAANSGHAKLGGRNKVFEISLERVSAKHTLFEKMNTEINGADLTKLAVEAKALEVTYTAMYATINKIHELSLVNFVR